MTVARASHSATLLEDGRVLIVGGCTLPSCEMDDNGASAELYDPDTGVFTRTGAMATERVGHTATLLPGGRVLVAGGFDRNSVVAGAELYDPGTGAFSEVESMSTPRADHTATLLSNGKVLMAGGYDGNARLASAELYDPGTRGFAPAGEMPGPRGGHASALVSDGRLLLTGGAGGPDNVLASAVVYDAAKGTFQQVGEMTVVRYKHAAVALPNGKALILGGSDERDGHGRYNTAELFDPATGTFSPTGSMSEERYKLSGAVVLLPSGEVMVGGGGELVELYDPLTGRFRTASGTIGADLAFATTTLLQDGRVLIAGGYGPSINPVAGTWIYDPSP